MFQSECICEIQVHRIENMNIVLEGYSQATQQELKHRQLSDASFHICLRCKGLGIQSAHPGHLIQG